MKYRLSLFLVLFIFSARAQVTGVLYHVEYNDETNLHDCSIVINSGSATSVAQRIQFNSQYSLIVPAGSDLEIVETYNPLLDNIDYNGTDPIDWAISMTSMSPSNFPNNDFYSIVPNLDELSNYNNLTAGDTVKLFSVLSSVGCIEALRPLDPSEYDLADGTGSNYANGFTIGGVQQLYQGNTNQPNNNGTMQTCVGEVIQLIPASSGWTSTNPSVATISSSGLLTAGAAGVVDVEYDNGGQCMAVVEITVYLPPIVSSNSLELCPGETTNLFPSIGCTWVSSDATVATVNNQGVVTGIDAGICHLVCTDLLTGCESDGTLEITVGNAGVVSIAEEEICVGETTIASTAAGLTGTWVSTNNSVATITNAGIVTGVAQGVANFIFTSTVSGCSSDVSADLLVKNCDPVPLPLLCEDALYFCDISDMNGFRGTVGEIDNPVGPDPLCPSGGVPTSMGWIRFQAAASGNYNISITPYECVQGGSTSLGIQLGVYTDCSFTTDVFCEVNCTTSVVNISSVDLEPGSDYFLFIDGCGESVCQYEIQITGAYTSDCEDPCDDTTPTEWDYAPAGEFYSDHIITAYTTGSDLMSDGLDHLIFYDSNTGSIYLKTNTGQGYLDQEVVIITNVDHDLNGEYGITLADIDNDGRTDLILTETNLAMGDRLSVYHNVSDGVFVEVVDEMLCGMQGPEKIQIHDFDENGMKDIFWICTDYLYGVMSISQDWMVTRQDFPQQVFCYSTILGDFSADGLTDILFNDGTYLLNNGGGLFEVMQFAGLSVDCDMELLYNPDTKLLVNQEFTFLVDGSFPNTDIALCSDHFLGGEDNVFLSNVCSATDPQVVVTSPSGSGISAFDFDIACEFDFEVVTIDNVVAAENTQIDLTGNGYTDFLVIDGLEIWAWINPKSKNKISGTAYIDENGNGTYDSSEQPLRNVQIALSPGDMTLLTGDDGSYQFAIEDGTYTLTAQSTGGMWAVEMLTIDNILITEPCNEGYNFGFVPEEGPMISADISVINTIARCDFETRFDITIENTSAADIQGTLVFEFDDETTFFSSTISGFALVGDQVTAATGTLAPFQPKKYRITLKMPSGSSNLPLLAFKATLYNQFGDVVNEYAYTDQLRCSYDPNDKRGYPDREGDDNLTLMDEDIEYTIRFQNNGNDTAFQVRIVDPIDPNIDPSTIRLVASSHEVETCIEDANLIFIFEDIMLVDSMTNYPGSQGYVTFRCNAKDGRAEMTPVHNEADIIFDTNAPIVTNQTINTLVSSLCTDVTTTIEVSICEGETFSGYGESGVYMDTVQTEMGCDSTLILVLEVQGITYSAQDVTLCLGESVVIGGSVVVPTENMLIIDTLYNAIGCISTIQRYDIEVNELEFALPDAFCIGSSFSIIPDGVFSVTSSDATIIEIDASGSGLTLAAGTVTLTISDEVTGCSESVEATVSADPAIEILGSQILCIGDSTQLTSDVSGSWVSQDPGVASVNNDGLVIANNTGSVGIDIFDDILGCSNSIIIEVLPLEASQCLVSIADRAIVDLQIYPNPARDIISITSAEPWNNLKIMNAQGQVVKSEITYQGAVTTVDIEEMIAGLYLLIVDYGGDIIVTRMVVD